MSYSGHKRSRRDRLSFARARWWWASAVAGVALTGVPAAALADEAGISFWVPGIFGSLAAAPLTPGFSLTTVYYHTSIQGGGDVAVARQVSRGNLTGTVPANLDIHVNVGLDAGLAIPTYVFATPVLGGQATIGLLVPYGRLSAAVDQTISARLGSNAFRLSGAASDSVTGFGDLWPQASLRWNQGVHNFMTYVFADVPVGRYDATRLANLGLGHSAVDSGGGYTYFDPQTGNEFSAVLGFTYNFKNQSTQYQNGVDIHLDWGASKFLTKQLQIGLVGYGYNQLSCDSGSGALLGCFESRVVGVGPQIGYILPLGEMQAYFNVKGYKEFDAAHRPRGWNTWLTISISPAASTLPSSTRGATR